MDPSRRHLGCCDLCRLPDEVRDRLLCDTDAQPVWERDGIPFSVGRTQRIVPERTRRIIEHRDRGCRVPGCNNHRYVEVHHIVHWLEGGPTDTANLITTHVRSSRECESPLALPASVVGHSDRSPDRCGRR